VSQVHDRLNELPQPMEYKIPPELTVVPSARLTTKRSFVNRKTLLSVISIFLFISGVFLAARHFYTRSHAARPVIALTDPQLREELAHGNMSGVVTLMTEALTQDPKNSNAAINIAFVKKQTANVSESETWLRKALEMNSGNSVAYNNLARLSALKKNWPEAIELYKKALSLRPDYPEAAINLAAAYEASGQPALSIPQYAVFLKYDQNHGELHPVIEKRLRLLRAFEIYLRNHKDDS
jgi:tetratricopeptide (TPR) repeat protein